ncbi:hypothetical protein PIB30_047638 [Stylosanthes scabra]|uniref:Uncharacterized protein n=1 Tax=Stylosanthes scabra TaxID=79078 RepID=A0ABU6THG7_9FABA|nr:hypothetical protein [Stylosanthes scabra]
MEEGLVDPQHPNRTRPSRLSVDSHFIAPAASGHYAARQSFDSAVVFVGEEDEEAARYMKYPEKWIKEARGARNGVLEYFWTEPHA